jgi:uncharacterized protein (UPF0264 family)
VISGPAPHFLASVRNTEEAVLAARLGADIIDLKEPQLGALGAVPAHEQKAILAALGHRRPTVSATAGDLPFEPETIVSAVHRSADVGVDLVKVGLFAKGETVSAGLAALARAWRDAPPAKPVVVLFLAEMITNGEQAATLAAAALDMAAVAGVMLDTMGKVGGSLLDRLSFEDLERFVAAAHRGNGFAGLAGSLRPEQVPLLAATGADVLGFRGALCRGCREASLSAAAFARVRDQIASAKAARSAVASPA